MTAGSVGKLAKSGTGVTVRGTPDGGGRVLVAAAAPAFAATAASANDLCAYCFASPSPNVFDLLLGWWLPALFERAS